MMDVEYDPKSQVQKLAYVQKTPPTLTPPCKSCVMKVVKQTTDEGEYVNNIMGFISEGRNCNQYCFSNLGNVLAPFLMNLPTNFTLFKSGTGSSSNVTTPTPNVVKYNVSPSSRRVYIEFNYENGVTEPYTLDPLVWRINQVVSQTISNHAQGDLTKIQRKQTTEYKIWKTYGKNINKVASFFEQQFISNAKVSLTDEVKREIKEESMRRALQIRNVVKPRGITIDDFHVDISLKYVTRFLPEYTKAITTSNRLWNSLDGDFDFEGKVIYKLRFDADIFFPT